MVESLDSQISTDGLFSGVLSSHTLLVNHVVQVRAVSPGKRQNRPCCTAPEKEWRFLQEGSIIEEFDETWPVTKTLLQMKVRCGVVLSNTQHPWTCASLHTRPNDVFTFCWVSCAFTASHTLLSACGARFQRRCKTVHQQTSTFQPQTRGSLSSRTSMEVHALTSTHCSCAIGQERTVLALYLFVHIIHAALCCVRQ